MARLIKYYILRLKYVSEYGEWVLGKLVTGDVIYKLMQEHNTFRIGRNISESLGQIKVFQLVKEVRGTGVIFSGRKPVRRYFTIINKQTIA
ncbi:hypothetical protein [Tepidimicrobium xylanilyticum]|uniref:Uncharacterized protein n=1 Tax=Tepidimicrobium xylanilyticum TaxID=1123352 RepID=A0A1H2ZL36_9FIRM|nr:hypothetical protein [Tepidimicrobium xylanilyticum]GMG96521.1 hypothetical protein EN5CB1_13470 [Tepidimicrobium xylanilyticum]SDX18096.1 hypothetical protein SAMN05660923_01873 [Tepidimicrobium xylanilyticum]